MTLPQPTEPAAPRLRQRPARRKGSVAIAAVMAISGLIFAANAQLANTSPSVRQPQDLADLVRQETERVAELTDRAGDLQTEVLDLSDAVAPAGPMEHAGFVTREQANVGAMPVSGPGITVVLDDAPPSSANIPGVTPDDLVIHQQDLQDVIQALWAGGAEAMTLMGERVTMTSAFRCSGNVLLLHGRVFSPPYVVQAIGDAERMQAALDASPGIETFLGYVAWLGLGFNWAIEDHIEMPAYTGVHELRHASVPGGLDPFRFAAAPIS